MNDTYKLTVSSRLSYVCLFRETFIFTNEMNFEQKEEVPVVFNLLWAPSLATGQNSFTREDLC